MKKTSFNRFTFGEVNCAVGSPLTLGNEAIGPIEKRIGITGYADLTNIYQVL